VPRVVGVLVERCNHASRHTHRADGVIPLHRREQAGGREGVSRMQAWETSHERQATCHSASW
jgi:hypothetical protein